MAKTKFEEPFDGELLGIDINVQIALMRRKLEALDTLFGDSPGHATDIRELREELDALEARWRYRQ